MSDLEKTVAIIFSGVDELSGPINKMSKNLDSFGNDMAGKINNIDLSAFEKSFISVIRTITTDFGDLKQWEEVKENLGKIFDDIAASFGPAMGKVDFSGKTATKEIIKVGPEIELIPSHKETHFAAFFDQKTFDSINDEIEILGEDKTPVVTPKADQLSFDKVTKNLAVMTAHENKTIEIQLQGNIDRDLMQIQGGIDMELAKIEGDIEISLLKIKSQADMVQAVFEWEAKLDIAQVEADAKIVAAAFDAAASSVGATASAAADMFSSLAGNWDKFTFASDRKAMMGLVREQIDMEREALSIQRDLTTAQIEYMQAKSDALRDGDGLIKIDSSGLEPALEMVMWQILEKVQLRATEEAAEFLLGLGTGDAE